MAWGGTLGRDVPDVGTKILARAEDGGKGADELFWIGRAQGTGRAPFSSICLGAKTASSKKKKKKKKTGDRAGHRPGARSSRDRSVGFDARN